MRRLAVGSGAAALAWLGYALFLSSFWRVPAALIDIPQGLGAAQTSEKLQEAEVLRSPLLFRAALKLSGYDTQLKPGRYLLKRDMAVWPLITTLQKGAVQPIKVIIPEGFSARQIAERLEANGICAAREFIDMANGKRLEGYLFPATYEFDGPWPAEKAANAMYREFERVIRPEIENANPKPKLTLHQVVTLASIVQREAVLAHERPLIAAVYLNRMRIRKMLEADPTVQYALGHWKKGLTLADLKTPSPYNTYMHYGLPPGPICSPSVESVRAVLRPASITAIYFVADAKGGHTFSATLEEHIRAKQAFKRDLRRQRQAQQGQ